MTAENLAKHRYDPNIAFWKNLKEGSDYFEVAKEEPRVSVVSRQYAFSGDSSVMTAVAQKRQNDKREVAGLVAKGVQPIKLVYDDGGQHQTFRQALADNDGGDGGSLAVDASARNRLGDVSRPEALAAGPQEIVLAANGKPKQAPTSTIAYTSHTSTSPMRTNGAVPLIPPAPTANAAAEPTVQAAGGEDRSVIERFRGLFGG